MKPNIIAAWAAHFLGDVLHHIGSGAHRVREAAYSASEWALCWAIHLQGDDRGGPLKTYDRDDSE